MVRCALDEDEERQIKAYVEVKGLIYLCTPFSRAAADRGSKRLGVQAYKIGSGECNNYPLISHIASFGKPVILSTGMNDLALDRAGSRDPPRAPACRSRLLHCTSMYPTPYDKVRLGAIPALRERFPDAVIGLSDHSLGNYTCFGAVALGASILEKHFTSDMTWPGPDVPISIDPEGLRELVDGSRAIHAALGGTKDILREEQPTIDFAYACVVTIRDIVGGRGLDRRQHLGQAAGHRRDPRRGVRGDPRKGRPSRHRTRYPDPSGGHWLNQREAVKSSRMPRPS